MDKVEEALCGKEWYICALTDGSVSGPGYNYSISHDVKEYGHKVLINSKYNWFPYGNVFRNTRDSYLKEYTID